MAARTGDGPEFNKSAWDYRLKSLTTANGRRIGVAAVVALAGAAVGGGLSRGQAAPLGPVASWVEDLEDVVDDAGDEVEDAEDAIAGRVGPLPEATRSAVAADLEAALALIDRVLDPEQYPSLEPADAGFVDKGIDPQTLPEYAEIVTDLARAALDEIQAPVIDDEEIGTLLKTIEYLITRDGPHNYRTLAGIK